MESMKKTMGRRKIEIKKIQNKTRLQVAFSKRRRGLFRKASELAVLCGVEVAILVQSPSQKLFAFGHPSVEAVINRASLSPEAAGLVVRRCHDGRRKLEEATKMLEMEKRRAAEKEMSGGGGGCWWEESVEGLELQELEEYLKALEDLEANVSQRLKISTAPPSSSSIQGFCASSSIQDLCSKLDEPIQDFCSNLDEPIQDFCASSSIQDFCSKLDEPIQDFCAPSSIQDFCSKLDEPIQDFCNPNWPIQELGDESSLNPYAMMMEYGYGLEFLS